MQNKFIKSINMSTKILILLILIMSVLVSKSLYLISIITILVLIISIISNKCVKFYLDVLKNNFIWLLFFSIMYIIIFRNIYFYLILVYKLILITLILKVFTSNLNFDEFNFGVYTLLHPLKYTRLNIKKISYNIAIYVFYIIYFIE